MKTIWEFPINLTDYQTVAMPVGAQILSAQLQDDRIKLWAVVNPNAPKIPRNITIYGTGNPIKDEIIGTFVGTVQME